MAKMLGNSPRGQYSCCPCRMCRRKPSEDRTYRRAQRATEAAQTRAEILDELVAEAAEHDLYALTAEPRRTR